VDVVTFSQQLLRIDSVRGGEAACIAPAESLLQPAGFACTRFEFASGRPPLVARRDGPAPLCVTGHVDVVPVGAAAWRHDPFGALVGAGRLYGCGAGDMKGGRRGDRCHGAGSRVYKIVRAALGVEAFRFDDAPHALMGSPTINVGTVANGANVNSVSDPAEMRVDLQTLLDVPPVCTELDDLWFARSCATVQPVRGRVPGNLDGQLLQRCGSHAPALADQTDEYVDIDALHEAQPTYAGLIEDDR
jgi:hypothetical protein